MKRLFQLLIITLAVLLTLPAHAKLVIDIVGGSEDPIVISTVPFMANTQVPLSKDIAAIVNEDLKRSGYFDPVPRNKMLSRPHFGADINFKDWRELLSEYLVIGRTKNTPKGIKVEYELYNVIGKERILQGAFEGSSNQLRYIAHLISDQIIEKITGVPGIFATQLAFVTRLNLGPGRFSYRLISADSDGENQQTWLSSAQPIGAPTWSPDRSHLAYVSAERGKPEIFIQNSAGKKTLVASYKGMNSAPSWSPDGSKLAFTLSKDGNAEIYVYNISTRSLKRVTRNASAIDTSASWFPDNQNLVITSDRGGQTQLYKVNIGSGQTSRLSYTGSYNAEGKVLPNGKGMVMMHRTGGNYKIAYQDFASGAVRVISSGPEDGSPSVSANSQYVVYTATRGGKDSLQVVSIDGRTRYYLPINARHAFDATWSQ